MCVDVGVSVEVKPIYAAFLTRKFSSWAVLHASNGAKKEREIDVTKTNGK